MVSMKGDPPFRLPAEFVLGLACPSPGELAYGYQNNWITRQDVVSIAVAKHIRGCLLTEAEDALVLLLPDDLDLVPDLVESLAVPGQSTESRARLWLFLSLSWLLEHRAEFRDPYLVIENLYSLFEYPDEMKGFVRFMPISPGEELGLEAMQRRWEQYVATQKDFYRERDPCLPDV
jgi:hypothetical protein